MDRKVVQRSNSVRGNNHDGKTASPTFFRKAAALGLIEEYLRQQQHQEPTANNHHKSNNNKSGSNVTNGNEDSQHDMFDDIAGDDDDVFAEDENNNGVMATGNNRNCKQQNVTPSTEEAKKIAAAGSFFRKKQTLSLSMPQDRRQHGCDTTRIYSTSSALNVLAFSCPLAAAGNGGSSSDDEQDDDDDDENGHRHHQRRRSTLVPNMSSPNAGNVLLRVRRDYCYSEQCQHQHAAATTNSSVPVPSPTDFLSQLKMSSDESNSDAENKKIFGLAFETVKLSDQDQFVKAAALGLVDKIIEYLSTSKFIVDIDGQSSSGVTAIHAAVLRGNVQCVELLIQKGANCEVENSEGDPPLHIACKGNWHRLVSILLAGGAKINTRNRNMQTPLHIAVHEGCKETVDLLLKRGAVNCYQDKDGNTPLHLAIIKKSDFITSALLEHGDSSVTIVNNNGFNVLHYASKYGYTMGAELILTHLLRGNHVMRTRGSISASISSDTTLVAPATASPTLPLTLQGQRRWVIDEPKQDGFTALHLAMANGHADIVAMLLKAGAKVNVQTSQTGSTPLHLAIEERLFKAAIAFLQNCPTDTVRGVIVDLADQTGCTVLHKILAAYSEAYRTRKASLRIAKHVNDDEEAYDVAEDSTDDAVSSGEAATVDTANQRALRDCAFIALWLVQAGASLNSRNRRGKSPLDFCIDQTFADILQKRVAKRRQSVSVPRQGSTSGLPRDNPSRSSVSGADSPLARTATEVPTGVGESTTPTIPRARLPSGNTLRKGSISLSSAPAEPSPLATTRMSLAPVQPGESRKMSRISVSSNAAAEQQSSGRRSSTASHTSTVTMTNNSNNAELSRQASSRLLQQQHSDSGAPSPTHQHHSSTSSHHLPKMSISDVLFTPPPTTPTHSVFATSPAPVSPRKNSVASTQISRHRRNESDGSVITTHNAAAEERDRYQQMLLESREESLCPLCKMRPRRIAFIPCGHYFCQPCGDRLDKCPTCRREITKADKLELYS